MKTKFGFLMEQVARRLKLVDGAHFEYDTTVELDGGVQTRYVTSEYGKEAAEAFAKVFREAPDVCDIGILNECVSASHATMQAWMRRSWEIDDMPMFAGTPLGPMVIAFQAGVVQSIFECMVRDEHAIEGVVMRGFHAVGLEAGRGIHRLISRKISGRPHEQVDVTVASETAVMVSVRQEKGVDPLSDQQARDIANAAREAASGKAKAKA